MKNTVSLLLMSLTIITVRAQKFDIEKHSFISGGLTQIKESANFGLVFTGGNFHYGMQRKLQLNEKWLSYENELGLQLMFSKKIAAAGVMIKPLEVAWQYPLTVKDNALNLGPSFRMEYWYQMYPDLQSGFDYWFSHLSIGGKADYSFPFKNKNIILKINTTLFGFVSRQPAYRDPYFYDLGVKYAIKHLHSHFSFSTLFRYSSTDIECVFPSAEGKRVTWAYVFRYGHFGNEPKLNFIQHNIKLIISKKR